MWKKTHKFIFFISYIFVFVWIRLYIVYRREDERRKIERETWKKGSRDAVGDHCCHYKVTVTSSNSICQYSNSESKCPSHTTRAHARNYTFRINALRFQRRKLWHFFVCFCINYCCVSQRKERLLAFNRLRTKNTHFTTRKSHTLHHIGNTIWNTMWAIQSYFSTWIEWIENNNKTKKKKKTTTTKEIKRQQELNRRRMNECV